VRLALVACLLTAAQAFAQQQEAQPNQEETNAPGEEQTEEHKLTKAPRLKTFVEAEYPPEKKAKNIEAEVLLSIEIAADGHVEKVTVVKSAAPDFDASAIAAAQKFVFDPAEIDGKPAPVKITYKYTFAITTRVVKLGPQVNFEGTVLERFTKKPFAGVNVALDTGASADTDDKGHFEFVDVPLGSHKVTLSAKKLITVSTEETLEKDQKKTVKYFVEERQEGIDEETVVRAARIKKETVQTVIRTEEARRVPGTQGDTLKVVQNLPGVARSALGSGAIIVWGSAPNDTRVNVDGVEIPALYHVGGWRSTVNSDLVRSIDLTPGGYGAEYGRGLGGLVRVETKALPAKGIHGYVAADTLDASAMLSAAIGNRLRIAFSGRYSYLDKLLSAVTSQDIGELYPIPRYDDYQFMAALKLRKDEELQLLFLASDDHLRRSITSSDPAEVRSENTDQTFYRLILRYTQLQSDGGSVAITPSFGYDYNKSTTKFGATPTLAESEAFRYGLRASYRRRPRKWITLNVGLDLQGQYTRSNRSGSLEIPPREGDIFVFGRPPGDDVNADKWTTHVLDAGPYVNLELAAGPVTIIPGLRIDAFMIDGDQSQPPIPGTLTPGYSHMSWGIDPRLQINWKAHKRVNLSAAIGLYHQAPTSDELSAVFGNPQLNPAMGIHFSLATAVKITGTLTAEVVGFYKQFGAFESEWSAKKGKYDQLWDEGYQHQLLVRNELPTPPLAQALTQEGIGRSYGGQILVRQELFKGFFGWVTYSISRSERKDHPDRPWRLFDFDQTHVLGIVASYEYKGWAFGVRFRYTSGMPRTPVTGVYYDPRGDQYQPLFGAQNSIRIPDFKQLDVRVDKTFNFRRLQLNVFLDVQNVTYTKNPEEIIYNFNFTQKAYITGLPTLAVLGLRLQF
jgi:TonB family protein